MKIQDFDSEVNALFEEDSVLAQAVVNLQERRKRISAENKDKNITILNNSLVSMENRGNSDKKQVSSIDDGIDLSEKTVSLSITDEEKDDDADLSLFETEALAVDPADVISYESFIAQEPQRYEVGKRRIIFEYHHAF